MKKKLLLFTALISFCFTVNAQESKFGVTTGYQSSSFKVSGAGLDISTDASGYFVGFFAQFSVSETFSIQPELHYSSVSDDGESIGDIIIPVMLKFHLTDEFNFMAGPQFDYLT